MAYARLCGANVATVTRGFGATDVECAAAAVAAVVVSSAARTDVGENARDALARRRALDRMACVDAHRGLTRESMSEARNNHLRR